METLQKIAGALTFSVAVNLLVAAIGVGIILLDRKEQSWTWRLGCFAAIAGLIGAIGGIRDEIQSQKDAVAAETRIGDLEGDAKASALEIKGLKDAAEAAKEDIKNANARAEEAIAGAKLGDEALKSDLTRRDLDIAGLRTFALREFPGTKVLFLRQEGSEPEAVANELLKALSLPDWSLGPVETVDGTLLAGISVECNFRGSKVADALVEAIAELGLKSRTLPGDHPPDTICIMVGPSERLRAPDSFRLEPGAREAHEILVELPPITPGKRNFAPANPEQGIIK